MEILPSCALRTVALLQIPFTRFIRSYISHDYSLVRKAIGVLLYPKMPARQIVGSDVAHAVPLTLIAGLGHSILGTVNYAMLVSLLVGSLPAIVVASIAAARASDTTIRVSLGVILLLVCARFWFLA